MNEQALDKPSSQELAALQQRARALQASVKRRKLALNMARGKPAAAQLDLAEALLELPGRGHHLAADGTDCRNYGGNQGLPELRALFAELIGAAVDNTVAAGNSSLALMYDHLVFSLLKGNPDSLKPWSQEAQVKFLCPVPGYDYHFNMTEEYGIEMIPVALGDDGPDMDQIEALVAEDPAIKGMWCVPKYSNPTGAVYSDEVVERLAWMKTAAPDFRIFWDNAYFAHHLTPERIEIANLLAACARHGHPNRALVFASTSKITFAGAGVAAFASSAANVQWFLQAAGKRSIGPDKINQLRHHALLPNAAALHALMDEHRHIIAPKFVAVDRVLHKHLAAPRVATWTTPRGGYFISLFTPEGCARRVVELASELGVTLTPAGAAFPYGHDPQDHHIRIAPTALTLAEAEQAAEGIAAAVLLAVAEQGEAGN